MADMLKSLPFLTVEDYLWKYSASFIRLMAYDQSRIKYLKNKEEKQDSGEKVFTADDVLAGLGMDAEKRGVASVKGDFREMLRNQQNKQ